MTKQLKNDPTESPSASEVDESTLEQKREDHTKDPVLMHLRFVAISRGEQASAAYVRMVQAQEEYDRLDHARCVADHHYVEATKEFYGYGPKSGDERPPT